MLAPPASDVLQTPIKHFFLYQRAAGATLGPSLTTAASRHDYQENSKTYMDGVEDLHRRFTAVFFVENFVDFPVGSLPDGLNDFPGAGRIWKVVKDDRFPGLWKHLQEISPVKTNVHEQRKNKL